MKRTLARVCLFWGAGFLVIPRHVDGETQVGKEGVKAYQKTVILEVSHKGKKIRIKQTRWYLENRFVRLAVIDDPGGAVVEFTDKATAVNYVAGEVYAFTEGGETIKKTGWGWKDYVRDYNHDPIEKWAMYQKYKVEFQNTGGGARAIKVTGQTAEQRIERWHILEPGSPQLMVRVKQTNISDHPRSVWIRWYPNSYVSSDHYGDSACVLSPGEGDEVRRVYIGWGCDHWLRTVKNYWLGEDWRTGEGLFVTFDPEKVPYHFTWTYYKGRNPLKGTVTLETLPVVEVKKPGESIETRFTYCPFNKSTKPDDIPLGLVEGKDAVASARRFLRRVTPVANLRLMNRYTFARAIQFHWHHRRRDKMGVRDWGFADCAVIMFPLQKVPMRVWMVGAAFDAARKEKRLANGFNLAFTIFVTNEAGERIYTGNQRFELFPGVDGRNYFDREMPVVMAGIPDGKYTVRVEALDPLTRRAFHRHEMETVVFGGRMAKESARGEDFYAAAERERPFVAALARIREIKVQNGKVIIPIGVEDGSGVKRTAFPVRLGMPFPKGAFEPNVRARLLSPAGKVVNAHCSPMNVWPDGSLKWLLLEFQADCPPSGFSLYRLEVGKGVTPVTPGKPLAKMTDSAVEINTGPMLIRVDRKKLGIPGEVFIDFNGDGRFDAAERVMLPSRPYDAWWEGQGNRFYGMQLGGETSYDNKPGVSIESNNDLSAVVKIAGWYRDAKKEHVAFGEIRVEAFRGKTFFKIWHRVTFTGSPWKDKLVSYGLKLRLRPGQYKKTFFDIDGRNVRGCERASSLYQ